MTTFAKLKRERDFWRQRAIVAERDAMKAEHSMMLGDVPLSPEMKRALWEALRYRGVRACGCEEASGWSGYHQAHCAMGFMLRFLGGKVEIEIQRNLAHDLALYEARRSPRTAMVENVMRHRVPDADAFLESLYPTMRPAEPASPTAPGLPIIVRVDGTLVE